MALSENSIQLVPDSTLVLHLGLIVLLLWILNRTLLKPINLILEERDRRTRGRLEEARGTLAMVDQHLAQYERALREARTEGYRQMEAKRAEAMRKRESGIRGLKDELQILVNTEKTAIASQAQEARRALELEAGKMAQSITSHILGRRTSESI